MATETEGKGGARHGSKHRGHRARRGSRRASRRRRPTRRELVRRLQEASSREDGGLGRRRGCPGRGACSRGGCGRQGRHDRADHRAPEPARRRARRAARARPSASARQWYFQRYVAHLPAAGEIVLFDRSWYNRAGVEHVLGSARRTSTAGSCGSARSSSACSSRTASSCSSTGSRSATRSRSAASARGSTTRCAAGSSRRSTSSSRTQLGRLLAARRTRCSCTPTSPRRRGTWSRPTTSGARASTASRTCSR